jgi:hypothetical protein
MYSLHNLPSSPRAQRGQAQRLKRPMQSSMRMCRSCSLPSSFEIETEQPLGPYFRCNCSLCSRKSAVMSAAPRESLQVAQGQELVSKYQWNTLEAEHFFCKVCGIHTHHFMRGETQTAGINMACIEGFDPHHRIPLAAPDTSSPQP